MTEKLYYIDSHIHSFEAVVTSCEVYKDHYAVTLDRTAFFPEGGGQPGDTGYIGETGVFDTHEKNGEVLHMTKTEIAVGTRFPCEIDWERRFRFMQNHSGEHIVSGITHKLYGYENVGFHMNGGLVTIDFDGELTDGQLRDIELRANRAVWENVEIKTYFPKPDELYRYHYRSKLELTENVRLVEVTGYDLCACCAPHVYRTGEIGTIKLLDSMRHRGGVRINMVCGISALEDMRDKYDNVSAISVMLSAKQNETARAVERLKGEKEKLAGEKNEINRRILQYKIAELRPAYNICIFENGMDMVNLRELVNAGTELAENICAAFCGDDENGYNYIIAGKNTDMKTEGRKINEALNGRGGGKGSMIQGSCKAPRDVIEKYFEV